MTAEQVVALLTEAAELNRDDPLREGSLLAFPNYGQLVMTGDFHGHKRNFNKLQRFCALDHSPIRHVLLHELIHAVPEQASEDSQADQVDSSHGVLLQAARWKCDYPDQVHFLLSNHDVAQFSGQDVMKSGVSMVDAFTDEIYNVYGDNAPDVLEAINEFIASQALAARTDNRLFMAHSLPGQDDFERFDPDVVHRPFTFDDLVPTGSAYMLVWGRCQNPTQIAALAKVYDVDMFIVGHQPQDQGCGKMCEQLLVVSSEHEHGCFLPIDLGRQYTIDELARRAKKFVAVP